MGTKTSTTDLITTISAVTGLPKSDVIKVITAFSETVTGHLIDGSSVAINGLGTFKPKHRAARQARNPRTGDLVDVAATNTAGFTAAKALKDALN